MENLDFDRDRSLVRRAVEKDEAAMREIVERHKDHVYRLAFRMVGDHDLAEDFTQETFLKVFENLSNVQNGRALTQWVRMIVTNLIRDRWKTKKDVVSFQEDHPDIPRGGGNPFETAAASEVEAHVQAALMTLPESQRQVFVLKYVEDLSYDEISDMLGIGVSAAKVRAHRACRALRDKLPEYDPN